MRLEFGEDTLLRTAAFVEGDDLAWGHSFVGDDDLEFVPVFGGLEQVELDRQLVLAPDLLFDEDEAIAGVPRLRLPAGLEVIEPDRHASPSFSAFDQFLEGGKALERNRDGEFDPRRMQSFSDGFVEKCAVDAGLYLRTGKARAHVADTVADEGVGPVGVVYVSRTMVNIEDLVGLGDGAKEGVVAARALLFLVETHCGSFGMPPGAQHRPVVIERHSRKSLVYQTLHDQMSRFTSHFGDTLFICTGERPADRGHVRQPLQTENPFDHLVITVVVHVSQPPVSDDQMHDQQHHDHMMAVNRIGLQVAETSPQPFFDADEREEVLKDDESRIRCQALLFESDVETQFGFTSNVGSAMLHLRGLRFVWCVVVGNDYCTSFGDHVSLYYIRFTNDSVRSCTRFRNIACGLSSLAVNLSHTLFRSETPVFCAVNACMGGNVMQLAGPLSVRSRTMPSLTAATGRRTIWVHRMFWVSVEGWITVAKRSSYMSSGRKRCH